MHDHAPFEDLPGQLDMWKDFSTPACNSVRAKNKPPEPDQDGLFDLDGVREICGRRQCMLSEAGEFSVMVTYQTSTTPMHAIAPGRWDPVSILKACSKAHCNRTYDVDESTAKPTNPEGLDEIRIARIVGANGLRPYLSRPSKYFSDHAPGEGGGYCPPALNAQNALIGPDDYRVKNRHGPGHPTWAFYQIMCEGHGDVQELTAANSDIRRAFRALEDTGLVRILPGPRGGFTKACIRWRPRAELPKKAPRPVAFADDDDRALECMALGIK